MSCYDQKPTKAHLNFNKIITPFIRNHIKYDHKYSYGSSRTYTTKFYLINSPMELTQLVERINKRFRNVPGFIRAQLVPMHNVTGRTSHRSLYIYSAARIVESHYGKEQPAAVNCKVTEPTDKDQQDEHLLNAANSLKFALQYLELARKESNIVNQIVIHDVINPALVAYNKLQQLRTALSFVN